MSLNNLPSVGEGANEVSRSLDRVVPSSILSPVDRRIEQIFADLRAAKQKALMPFVCGGFPSPGFLPELLPKLEAAGASIVEIGFPFSDPIADGPVIAAAMHEALQAGSTVQTLLGEVAQVRDRTKLGLVAMVSISIVQRLGGPAVFAGRCKDVGFDGLIVPDLPYQESQEMRTAAAACGLSFSMLISPTSSLKRVEEIAAASTGLLYLLARAGITGEQTAAPEIAGRVNKLRGMTGLPIACGFGISTAEHVRAVVAHADAAIVGSGLVRRMSDAAQRGESVLDAAVNTVAELATGLVPRSNAGASALKETSR